MIKKIDQPDAPSRSFICTVHSSRERRAAPEQGCHPQADSFLLTFVPAFVFYFESLDEMLTALPLTSLPLFVGEMEPHPVPSYPIAVVRPESTVVEVVRATPPDAEYPVGMDILGDSLVGKVVCATWPNDSQTYMAVFSDDSKLRVTGDQALILHQRFLSASGVVPIRVAVVDKHLGWQFDPNDGDMINILQHSASPGSVVVEFTDTDDRSPIGVSVVQAYDNETHVGICFGKEIIDGQTVYLVVFDDGVCKCMSHGVLQRAAESFWHGYSMLVYVPIMAVL